jgi:hypothetical protein
LVIICVFTGFIILRPIKTNSAEIVANELVQLFCTFGWPKIIQSDNGPEFTNDVLRAVVKLSNIDHRLISPYNPRADGKVERSIGTVMTIIKKLLHGSDNHWPLFVPFAQLAFNEKVSSLTNSTPFSLMFGRSCNEMKDYSSDNKEQEQATIQQWQAHWEKILSVIYPAISDRIRSSKSKMIQRLNKNRRQLLSGALPNGAIVMLIDQRRQNKNEPPYVGPYSIIRRTQQGNYVLKDESTKDILDRHVPPDQLKLVSRKPRDADLADNQYEVQSILKHRGSPGNYQYYVKWKDYNDRTWESAASFLDDKIIKNYWKQVKEDQAQAAAATSSN